MTKLKKFSSEYPLGHKKVRKKWTSRDFTLFFIACAGAVFLFVFAYIPMAGILIAFKDDSQYFNIFEVIQYGSFVGFNNFLEFFSGSKILGRRLEYVGTEFVDATYQFPRANYFCITLK